jgi:hypothetical protein
MAIVLVPIKADRVKAWESFIDELNGSRKADFVDFNKRHKLTKHEAWLCETPAGPFVCAVHEGPGSADLIPNVARSTNAFDKWFGSKLSEIHGMDMSKPPPGKMPERKLSWTA